MSTEQSDAFKEVANSPGETGNSVAMTQQATTPTPTTTPKREKNPKRVAAGKAVAERTRLAREQQKKAAAEAAVIIANNNKASGVNPTPHTNKAPDSNPVANTQGKVADTQGGVGDTPTNSSLSTTQWIGVISIAVSLIGIYYKREELKAAFSKKQLGRPHTPSDESQPVRLTVLKKNTPEPQPASATRQPRGVKHLD